MTHDPLTHRAKHELREIDPDPKDWIEGPAHRRARLRPWWRDRSWLLFVCTVAAPAVVVVVACVLVKVFGR